MTKRKAGPPPFQRRYGTSPFPSPGVSWRFAAACLIAAWLWTGAAGAHTGLVIDGGTDAYRLAHALHYLEDPERSLSIEDVAAAAGRFRPVAPRTGDINFGYSHAAYWLALPVRLAPGAPTRWLLEIAYPSLDHVELYQRHPNGRYERQVAGDLLPRCATLPAPQPGIPDPERELHHLAHHDHLTGLANRLLLDDRIEHAIARCRRNGGGLAVLLVDLDGFKAVNDTHGHKAGDELLIAIAGRLSDCVRETDTVARQGGDEFVVVIEDIPGPPAAERVAEKIVAAVSAPVGLVTGVVQISASVGVALFPEHAGDRERLLKRADTAMYVAKSGGRRGWRMAGGPRRTGCRR